MSRIPGTKNAAQVTTASTTPAATSVPRVPIAPATGPVRAKDSGSRPIEMSQSRLETRPSMAHERVQRVCPGEPLGFSGAFLATLLDLEAQTA
jgi:hypothetical protein